MTNWIEIDEDTLRAFQLGDILDAARAAIQSGQDDPLDEILASIVTRIRAEVRGCKTNQVSATPNTIPPDLKSTAAYLVIEALQARVPGLPIDQSIKDLIAKADKYLERVSKCGVPIELPNDPLAPDDVQRAGAVSILGTSSHRITNRDRLSGI